MRWLPAIAELALLCWFVALGIEAMAQRVSGEASPFQLREFHHAYLGAALVLVGCLIPAPIGMALELLGVILTVDDTEQHRIQTISRRRDYVSPLHRLFAVTLWRLRAVRWLTAQLDRWWLLLAVLGLLALWLLH